MSAHANPDIVDDGLVFLYDTDDGKSFKGEPTTNYGPASFGDWGTESTAERIATGNTFNGQPTYNCRTVVGQSYRGIEKTISGLRTAAGSSGTVTMSCMVRNNNATAYNMFAYIGHDFGSTRSIAANSDWQKVQWTVNQSSMNNDYVEFRPYTNNASIYLEMTMPMVEVNKGHATQFVNGTRSATQGLLDRTGTSTINISNASFDSNAQMAFDGTDGYFEISDPNVSSSDGFSIELIIKPDNPTSSPAVIVPNSGGIDHWLRFDGNGRLYIRMIPAANSGGQNFRTSTQLSSGNYHHVVFTFKQSEGGKAYYNGALETSAAATLTALDWSSIWRIGQRGNNTMFFEGELPVLKVYNRALTAAEILQNFNATKSRFGL